MTAALFTTNGAALLEDLLQRGVSAGASLVEVFAERTDHLGLLAEQDTITSVNPSFALGAGIRVFRGERDGFVSTNDLSIDGLTRALDQALAMLGLESGTRDSAGTFQGLRSLINHAASKEDWLQRCPSMAEAGDRLKLSLIHI